MVSLFVLLIVIGFILQTMAEWGVPVNRLSAVAWLCWCIAAIIWAFSENVVLR